MSSSLFWKGLLSDNFRHWGPTQFTQYKRLLGVTQRVGIEMETLTSTPFSPQQLVRLENLKSMGAISSGRANDGGHRSVNYEYQILFDVTNPIKLVSVMKRIIAHLQEHDITTLGGLHLNYQVKYETTAWGRREDSRFSKMVEYACAQYDIVGADFTYYRQEYKGGVGFINWEDLLIQFIQGYAHIQEKPIPVPTWYPPTRLVTRLRNPLFEPKSAPSAPSLDGPPGTIFHGRAIIDAVGWTTEPCEEVHINPFAGSILLHSD